MIVTYAKQEILPDNQYYKAITKKNQIVLHHTVSNNKSAAGDIAWWKSTDEHVGAHFIITSDGTIVQCIDTAFWVHALGVSGVGNKINSNLKVNNVRLNQGSIHIELDNAGPVTADGVTTFKTTIPKSEIIRYKSKFRGYEYYQKYTDAQILSLQKLLRTLANYYKIPVPKTQNDVYKMFEIDEAALKFSSGIYTHVTYRTDKSDCHPQLELIQMLLAV